MQAHDLSRVPIQLVRHCAVASIQIDLTDKVLDQFRSDLLETLQRTNATGVVLDVSGVEVMDVEEFDALRQTMQMASLMGAQGVFSGFQPGVVSSLVELDAEICSIQATANLDDALALLRLEDTDAEAEMVALATGAEEEGAAPPESEEGSADLGP